MLKQYNYLVQKSLPRKHCIKYTTICKESGLEKNTHCYGKEMQCQIDQQHRLQPRDLRYINSFKYCFFNKYFFRDEQQIKWKMLDDD